MRISDFNKIVQGNDMDLARDNLYSIEVYMPRGHGGRFGKFYTGGDEAGIKEKLSYMAKSVTLPSKALGTIPAKRFGPVYKVANDLTIDTASMTFMCSEDYREHLFFDGWISGIMGQIDNPKTRQVYTLSYYNDYVGTVNIIPLDKQGGAAAQVTLKEAYPTGVGPIEFKWGAAGQVATFTVTWSFYDWNHTQTSGWSADTDLMGYGDDMGNISPWDFASQKYRESPAVIRKAESKMGSGLDHLNAQVGRSTKGFREAPDNRDNKYPGKFGKSTKGFRQSPVENRKMGSGLDFLNDVGESTKGFNDVVGASTKGFRQSPAVIKAERNKMGSGLEGLNAQLGRSTKGFREAPDNRDNKYSGVPGASTKGFRQSPVEKRKMGSGLDFLNDVGKSKEGFREAPAVIKAERNKMGSGLDFLNAQVGRSTKGFREAPGNTKGFREAPGKWVNPDTRDNKYPGVIPAHKTRLAPGHDGSLVKGIKGLLNILIR